MDSSAVTEWDLICDRRYLSALMNTIYFAGVTVGSFVCGVLADIWGRRRLVYVCLYVQGIFGILNYFSTTLEMFVLLRFIQGFFVQVGTIELLCILQFYNFFRDYKVQVTH